MSDPEFLERAQELFAEAIAAGPSERARSDVGLVIGPFRLAEQIGQGGMGAVYRAERVDGAFTQRVAVKLIDAALRSPDGASVPNDRFSPRFNTLTSSHSSTADSSRTAVRIS
jgi:serine/threonine protein kinase